MKKSILKAIPEIEWDSSWDHLATQLEGAGILYLAHGIVEKVDKEKVLIMSIFSKDKDLQYRVFISEEDYVTQEFLSDGFKWRTGGLDNILDFGYYFDGHKIAFIDIESVDTIYDFLGEATTPIYSIINHQSVIRGKRLAKKHQKEKNEIDERMNRVKKLPKNFEKWVEEKALFKSRYIVYKYAARKVVDGYCTHCKTDVKVEGPKHNEEGVCPNCKSPVTYKASGKVNSLHDIGHVALIQKAGDELVARYFYVQKNYRYGKYHNPDLWIREMARDFYTANGKWKLNCYEWANFKQTNEVRWCINNGYVNIESSVLYPSNLKRELKGTRYEYSAIEIYARKEVDFDFPVWRYLSVYPKLKQLEYLVKVGLTNIASQLLYAHSYEVDKLFNLDSQRIKDFLRLKSKERVETLIKENGTFKTLETLQLAEKMNISDEIAKAAVETYNIGDMLEVLEHTTYHKMNRYITKQLAIHGRNGYNDNHRGYMSIYKDYLRDCLWLGYDLKNDYFLFPKNLKEAHQETIAQIKERRNEIISQKLGEIFESLNERFKWEDEDFVVFPPKSHDELLTEGSKLKHCVAGSYSEKMANGETIILFMRKKDEIKKPFYTIEVSPKDYRIRQCRGQNNSNPVDEVKAAVERYEKKLDSLKKAS